MDRILCLILCVAVIVVSIYLLGYCDATTWYTEQQETKPIILEVEPEITEPTTQTEPTEPTEATVVTTPPTTEPEPTVALYDVPLSEDLQLHIISVCEEHGIDPAIVLAMIYRESSYRADAVGDGGSSLGLMQIQPRWHSNRMERLGCTDMFDPYQNVMVGIDYLAENLYRYGDIEKALTAYNRGRYDGVVTQYAKNVLATAKQINNERSQG